MRRTNEADELERDFSAVAAARSFWDRNASTITHQYENKWIAIRGDQVVAASETAETLVDILDAKKIPENELVIRFVHGSEVEFAF